MELVNKEYKLCVWGNGDDFLESEKGREYVTVGNSMLSMTYTVVTIKEFIKALEIKELKKEHIDCSIQRPGMAWDSSIETVKEFMDKYIKK